MFTLLLSLVVLYHKFFVRQTSIQLIPWGTAFHKELTITLLALLLSLMFTTKFTRATHFWYRTTNHNNNMNNEQYSFSSQQNAAVHCYKTNCSHFFQVLVQIPSHVEMQPRDLAALIQPYSLSLSRLTGCFWSSHFKQWCYMFLWSVAKNNKMCIYIHIKGNSLY